MEPLDRQAEPEGNARLIDWTVKYVVPLVGITGTALYGVLRLADAVFYMQLRATPQEVGYGYQEILAGQLFGTAELILLFTVSLAATALAFRAARHSLARRWREALSLPPREALLRLTRRCGLTALVVTLTSLPILAWAFGINGQLGYAVRNIYPLHTLPLTILAVQASPATITWSVPRAPGMPDISQLTCLLYLGRANGTSVFYDVENRDSLHLPSAQIVLTLPYESSVPKDCSQDQP